MTLSVMVEVENVIVISLYAYTYVCQISSYLIDPFSSYLANKKVVRIKKNK